MKKVKCDRCGKDCKNTYYKIAVFGYPIEDEYGKTTRDPASYNLSTLVDMSSISNKHFCKSCKEEIEKQINEPLI